MPQTQIDIPEDTLLALQLPAEGAALEVRLAAAMKLFELGRLSSGAAAQLAGIPRTVFLSKLADYGVPSFTLTEAELQAELADDHHL